MGLTAELDDAIQTLGGFFIHKVVDRGLLDRSERMQSLSTKLSNLTKDVRRTLGRKTVYRDECERLFRRLHTLERAINDERRYLIDLDRQRRAASAAAPPPGSSSSYQSSSKSHRPPPPPPSAPAAAAAAGAVPALSFKDALAGDIAGLGKIIDRLERNSPTWILLRAAKDSEKFTMKYYDRLSPAQRDEFEAKDPATGRHLHHSVATALAHVMELTFRLFGPDQKKHSVTHCAELRDKALVLQTAMARFAAPETPSQAESELAHPSQFEPRRRIAPGDLERR